MAQRNLLGDCPECGEPVPRGAALIAYERDGGPATYAECPDCLRVVRPE